MSAIPPADRIELSQAVRTILETDSPKSWLLKHFLNYLQALLAPDPAGLDSVVTPDGRCYELEAIGFPRGREGLKIFRRQVNAAIPDEHIFITAVRFEGDDIIEADMAMNATHTGELFDIPATGRTIASLSTSAADLSTASWRNDGPELTSKTLSASLVALFSRPHDGTD